MGKHLVLVGGGHAHMTTLANLPLLIKKGHKVTVIGPSEHHYYSGMGPGMLGNIYTPGEIRFATRHVVEKQGGNFILAEVVRLEPETRTLFTASGLSVIYDVVSFNVGSYVPALGSDDGDRDVYTVKPIEKLLAAQARILELIREKKITVAIAGGGPSAVEIAGNIWRLVRDAGRNSADIHLYTGSGIMGGYPEKVRIRIQRSLESRGINVHSGARVQKVQTGRITLQTGQSHGSDLIFLAQGIKPSPIFADSGLPLGPDGGLLVNRYLQCPEYQNIFGGGDCIYFEEGPLDKVGVYAVRQNPILLYNLTAAMDGARLRPFDPGGDYLLIYNLGDGSGVFRKKRLCFGGRPAFILKDYIDRRFMRKFQSLE